LSLCSRASVAAENLFLRKQLALYVERQRKPRRATDSIRFTLAQLCRFFDWRDALINVKPDTLVRWHRKGFRLFWKWKSRPRGRPRIPDDVRELIAEIAKNNLTWGEERIADELLLKIGIQISPRTVWRYMPKNPERPIDPSQRWMTFVRNHANALIACVTMHPTAQWTLQQFRECVTGEEGYRFVIHDRDGIYSGELDQSLKSLGLTVLKTPYKSPQANAFCERLIGSARRECLDFMIPFNEAHIRQTLKSWIVHYNRGRPRSSLGPGMPDASSPKAECRSKRHEIPKRCRVASTSILGGLHHEYRLERIAARRYLLTKINRTDYLRGQQSGQSIGPTP
jgi:putative transposase